MTMLIIDDSLVTAVFAEPLRLNWIATDIDVTLMQAPSADGVPVDAFGLVASPECTLLTDTHAIVPDVAVVAVETGAIAMRSPVRADAISDARVLLYETSATAEVLARALMWPYFGIAVREWTREPAGDVTVTIVDGAPALQPPEVGYSENLVRSWFVVTGMPVVSHVLLAPREAAPEEVAGVVGLLTACRQQAHERRRELRQLMDEKYGIERERLVDVLTRQRYSLDDADREALVSLIVKGAGGSAYRPITRLPFLDAASQEAER
jgi:predicted solute-binding protein